MTVFAGKDAGTARTTDRVSAEATSEDGAFAGDAINVGRAVDASAIRADGSECMVVAEEEEDVGTLGVLFRVFGTDLLCGQHREDSEADD